jgi:hypothetical protein
MNSPCESGGHNFDPARLVSAGPGFERDRANIIGAVEISRRKPRDLPFPFAGASQLMQKPAIHPHDVGVANREKLSRQSHLESFS